MTLIQHEKSGNPPIRGNISCLIYIRSFALACPYVRARTCVTVRANQQQQKKTTLKQPHRPFLRCRKQRLDWGIVFKKIEKEIEKVQKSRKKEYSKSTNREKIEK